MMAIYNIISNVSLAPRFGASSPNTPASEPEPILLAQADTESESDSAPVTITGGNTPATVSTCTLLQSCQSFPGQTADAYVQVVSNRRAQVVQEKTLIENQRAMANNDLRHHDPHVIAAAEANIASYNSQIAELELVLWLLDRNLGNDSISSVTDNLNSVSNNSAFWRALIAMILSSELENPAYQTALAGITSNDDWQNAPNAVEMERQALEQIYNQLLTRGSNNQRQPISEFSRLVAENYYRRAMIAQRQGDTTTAQTLLTEARTYADQLALRDNELDINTASLSTLRSGRESYIPQAMRTDLQSTREEFASANMLMGNILMQQALAAASDQQRSALLEEAEHYLVNTAPLAQNRMLDILEVRRALADNLIMRGHLQAANNGDPSSLFGRALCHLDYIIEWSTAFDSHARVGTTQRWLVNITTHARVARANLMMALIGQINQTTLPSIYCLIINDLEPQEQQDLQNGPSQTRVLEIQLRLLNQQAQQFTQALGQTYQYGSNTPIDILSPAEKLAIRLSLGENYARQAFISRDLNNQTDYSQFMANARTEFNQVLATTSAASPLIRAQANLWMAKIRLNDTIAEQNLEQVLLMLDEANTYLEAALQGNLLTGPLLDQAQQTGREISLARAEANMRLQQYSSETIAALETSAFEIFSSEAVDSALIPRTIKALIEAYSGNAANHPKIILICNILLDRQFTSPANPDEATSQLITAMRALRSRLTTSGQLALSENLQAWLYLKLADAISWGSRDQLDNANVVLNQLQSAYPALIDPTSGDPEIRTLYRLLRAEIEMRQEHNSSPIMNNDLAQAVRQSNQADLIGRLISDQVEGLTYDQNYTAAIDLIRSELDQTRLQQMEQLFGPNRQRNFIEYKFELWNKLIELLTWSNDYSGAQTESTQLLANIAQLEAVNPVKAQTLRAEISINLADIYRYQNNYQQAIQTYQELIALYPNTTGLPADTLTMLARAHLGLAEIYRYASGHQDTEAAQQQYEAVVQLANLISDNPNKQNELLARAYFGLAQLAREGSGLGQANLNQAAQHIRSALDHLNQMTNPPADLRQQIEEFYNDPHVRERLRPEITFSFQTLSGSDGRIETQLNFGGHLPFSVFHPSLSWLHLTGREQIDLGPTGNIYSTYAGARLLPHSAFSLDLQFRLATTGDAGASMLFFRHPDFLSEFFWYNEYVTLGGGIDLNFSDADLNAYRGQAFFNFDWTDVPVLEGLQLGAQCGSYPFYYSGEARRMNSCAFGPTIEFQPGIDWLTIQGNFMGLAYQTPDNDPATEDNWTMGWQAGAGIQFNVLRYLHFGANYWHQETNFPLNSFQGNATVSF
ncbi:MAG: tetratricopeptide repeat protein [Candidatus Margulisiibacteriota bacterium]